MIWLLFVATVVLLFALGFASGKKSQDRRYFLAVGASVFVLLISLMAYLWGLYVHLETDLDIPPFHYMLAVSFILGGALGRAWAHDRAKTKAGATAECERQK